MIILKATRIYRIFLELENILIYFLKKNAFLIIMVVKLTRVT